MININKEQSGYLLLTLDVTEANLNNSDKFKNELVALLDKHPQLKLVVEMNKVDYMDSSFLGAMVSALKHAMAIKSDVILTGLKKDISDLFSLIRLDKVFKIHARFDDVLNAK